jgi:hypothetical protein
MFTELGLEVEMEPVEMVSQVEMEVDFEVEMVVQIEMILL